MSEEVEQRLPNFIKFVMRELEKTNSPYRLKGYAMAGIILYNLATKKYEEIKDIGV